MKYRDIRKGRRYHGRLVFGIYPEGSGLAGPGLDQPSGWQDDVLYQDFDAGVRTSCSARVFAVWCGRQEIR